MHNILNTHHHGETLGRYQDYDLLECTDCGFIHVDPLPSVTDLKQLYDEQFYGTDKPDYLSKDEQEQPYWREVVYKHRYQVLTQLLAENQSKTKSILDIGCSGGFFLKYGQELGWTVLGLEPSRQAAAYARDVSGINVKQAYIQDIAFEKEGLQFDVVHLRNVLEHTPNPGEICQKALEALKPNGILCVEVPNDFNPLQQLAHQHLNVPQYWVAIPHHLNYFTPASLKHLLLQLGLEVCHQETSFPMELFLAMGENYVGNDPLGRACHQKRMQLEQALALTPEGRAFSEKLYHLFAEHNIGRTITLYARKPV